MASCFALTAYAQAVISPGPRPHHRWRGILGHIDGHQSWAGHWRVGHLREQGYVTVLDICQALGIGPTTYCRYEGRVLPQARRDPESGIRIFSAERAGGSQARVGTTGVI